MNYDLLVLAPFTLSRSAGVYYARGELVTDVLSIYLIERGGAAIQPKVTRVPKVGAEAVPEPFVLRMTDKIRVFRGLDYLTLRMRNAIVTGDPY